MNIDGNNIIGNEGIQPLRDISNGSSLPARKSNPTEVKTEDKGINTLSTGEEGNQQVVIPQNEISENYDEKLLNNLENVAVQGLADVKEELENQPSEEKTPSLAAINDKWLPLEGFETITNQNLYEMIKDQRSFILETKNNYLEKQTNAREKEGPLSVVEQSYVGSPETEKEVKNLMRDGSINKLGGKSGVYSLSGSDGKPKFIIKPMDERMMTLNNPKGYALPFSVEDALSIEVAAKPGILTYSALTNGELGHLVAKE